MPEGSLKAAPFIYLDHHATTPCDPRVVEAMMPFFRETFGNASSPHHLAGHRVRRASEQARRQVAQLIGAHPREIAFTSGATEALNLAILGLFEGGDTQGKDVIVSGIEHAAVLDSCKHLEHRGVEVRVLPVDTEGRVDAQRLASMIRPSTALVSVMLANNEVGTIQDLTALSAICRPLGVPLLSDCVQAAMWMPIDVAKLGIDMLVLSGHKMGGPQGVGALYMRRCRALRGLKPRQFGGGQERGLRAGTLPVALVVGLGEACALAREYMLEDAERTAELRDSLWEFIHKAFPDAKQNGALDTRLPNNLNITLPGVQADTLLKAVPGVGASSGAACSAERLEPSHVLRAMGLSDAEIYSSLRFGLGRDSTAQGVQDGAKRLIETVHRLRTSTSA